MKIGIIGTGRIGSTLARLWAESGHTVFLGSRSPERAEKTALEIGRNTIGLSYAAAARAADAILFAFPWYALIDVARDVGPLAEKIIIDCINPLTSSGSLAVGHSRSAAEEIAAEFPQARVIKAFNHIYYTHFEEPLFSGQPADAFYCSDSDAAKQVVVELAGEMGFHPVDLGPLKHARYLEPLAMIWIQRAFHLGFGPDFTIKFLPRTAN